MLKSDHKIVSKHAGLIIVVLISLLTLEMSILIGTFLSASDSFFTDRFMRWREAVSYGAKRGNTKDITLMAIDARTQNALGRYGAGMWLSRKPFIDNMDLLKEYFSPSVLAYDIILIDALSSYNRQNEDARVSENPETLKQLAADLLVSRSGDQLSRASLEHMNRLVSEQGNKTYVSNLADIQERNLFSRLLGMNLRGGSVDPSEVPITGWSDMDVFGEDASGDEDMGRTIPYLKDMSIPRQSIHFPKGRKSTLKSSPSGNMPTAEFLDYVYIAPINGPRDSDGIVRRLPMVVGVTYRNSKTGETKEFFMPSFALSAALLHLGFEFPLAPDDIQVYFGEFIVINSDKKEPIRIPIDNEGRLYLNFDNSFNDFSAISFCDLAPSFTDPMYAKKVALTGRWKSNLDDKVALIGITVTGQDVGATPLYPNIPLVFVQMTAINNILNQSFIKPLPTHLYIYLWCVLFCMVTAIGIFDKTFRLGSELFLLGVMYLLACYLCIHHSWYILPVIQPLTYIGACSFGIVSYRFFTEERAKRKIRGMFSTMVSDKVLNYLEENPQSFSLQGRNIETTVFFSDVANFTTISESLPPSKLTGLMNSYLTPVTNCIMDHGGYVDKYVGDGIMAVWGAPNPDPDHVIQACSSAIEQQMMIQNMNPEFQLNYGFDLKVRMGIDSGIVTAGNMGSEKKFQYTVMGDVVNLAARLEPVNKDFGTNIIIGDTTYQAAKDKFIARLLDRIVVKGKSEIVPIYELIGKKGNVGNDIIEVITMYELALTAFHNQEWDDALKICDNILMIKADAATAYLVQRAQNYKKTPPPKGWQGEYIRQTKT